MRAHLSHLPCAVATFVLTSLMHLTIAAPDQTEPETEAKIDAEAQSSLLADALQKLAAAKTRNERITARLGAAVEAINELIVQYEKDAAAKIAKEKQHNSFLQSFDPRSVDDLIKRVETLQALIDELQRQNANLKKQLDRKPQRK